MSARTSKPHEIVERALELSRADGCVVIADEQLDRQPALGGQRADHQRRHARAARSP